MLNAEYLHFNYMKVVIMCNVSAGKFPEYILAVLHAFSGQQCKNPAVSTALLYSALNIVQSIILDIFKY